MATNSSLAPLRIPRSRAGTDPQQLLGDLEELCYELKVGGVLPSHVQLMERFHASERAVRWALSELQRQGKVSRRRKAGTVVVDLGDSTSIVNRAGEAESQQSTAGSEPASPAASGELFLSSSSETPGQRPLYDESAMRAWILVQLEEYETALDRVSEFWPPRIVSRLEYRIAERGGKATITLDQSMTEDECVRLWDSMLDQGVNCVFFLGHIRSARSDVWIDQFARTCFGEKANSLRVPPCIVQISLSQKPQPYFDTVSYDNEWGTYLATRHLLELGHRNIAFLAPSAHYDWLAPRISGFHRAMRGFGLKVPRHQEDFGVIRIPVAPNGPNMWQEMGSNVAETIAANSSLTAVLATNDQMASTLLDRLRRLGRSVPESLSIVGHDDWFESGMQGLTTVHPPIDELADAALTIAKRRLNEGPLREDFQLNLKPTLMVRNTTKAVRT